MAILDGTKLFKNRNCLIHGHDLRRIDSPSQKLLRDDKDKNQRSISYHFEIAHLDILVLTCRLHG